MINNEFHKRILSIINPVLAKHGFALGGGYGLIAHNIIQRMSSDLDHYINSFDPKIYDLAQKDVIHALQQNELIAKLTQSDDWFKTIAVTNPETHQSISLDIGYDYRSKDPVHIDGVGTVLNLNDIVTGKIRAFWGRDAERDYADIDAIIQSSRYNVDFIWATLTTLRPDELASGELSKEALSKKMTETEQFRPQEFTKLGLGESYVEAMIRRMLQQARILTGQTEPTTTPKPPLSETYPYQFGTSSQNPQRQPEI